MKKFSCLFFQLFVIAVSAGSCHPRPQIKTERTRASEPGKGTEGREKRSVSFRTDAEESGLVFSLREASSQQSAAAPKVAEGKLLTRQEMEALLNRAVGESSVAQKKNFALREASEPAPKTGEVVETPLGETEAKAPSAVLKVSPLRIDSYAPEGSLELVPHVTITFSKPMVAVTDTNFQPKVAVEISPQPKGRWRWLGTRTLQFAPEKRMPMATQYRVTVPAGMKSADGTALEKSFSFSFDTPPLKMVNQYPVGGPYELNETVFIAFNQQIDAEALLPFIDIRAGGKSIGFRPATREEEEEFSKKGFSKMEEYPNRLVLIPKQLPRASTIEVRLKAGSPSMEGPLATQQVQQFDFYTYHPLRLTEANCGYGEECRPNEPLSLMFNNEIDSEVFTDDMVKVTPAIENMSIAVYGQTMMINGLKQGRTTYKVTVNEKLQDRYAQTLRNAQTEQFVTGQLSPTLVGPPGTVITLSPFDKAAVAVHSMNHSRLKTTVHRVDAADFEEWVKWRYNRRQDEEKQQEMPGTSVLKRTLSLQKNDQWQHSIIDLSAYLKNGVGHFAVWVEPVPQAKEPWNRQEVIVWVQVTQLGVSAFMEHGKLLVWTNQLADGAPVTDANVTLWPGRKISGQSDMAGLTELSLTDESATFLVATRGEDSAILYPGSVDSMIWGGGGWQRVTERNSLSCYALTDRGMYKPGEIVQVKGWLREIGRDNGGTITGAVRPVKKVRWSLTGPRRNPLANGEVNTTDLGGFHIEVKLPKNANLGSAELELISDRSDVDFPYQHKYHHFQIQEFKKPEFEVTAQASDGPHILGETAEATISARYYTGESLRGAPVQWRVSTSPADYTPPNHSDFNFGTYRPYWRYWGLSPTGGGGQSLDGKTGAEGEHILEVHFESLMSREPTNVHFSGTVTDVNRQQWTANTDMLVHPANRYVGMKLDENFVHAGDKVDLDVVVTDIDGERTAGEKVDVALIRMDETWKDGAYKEEEVQEGECQFTAKQNVHRCTFTPKIAGNYRWIAATKDAEGRPAQSVMWLWVTGDKATGGERLQQNEVRIIPKKETWNPGESAALLIQTPFYPAEGLVTVRKSGLRYKKRISFTGPTQTVTVPITEKEIPKVTVQVDVNGKEREDGKGGSGRDVDMPAFATGRIVLTVSPYKKRLNVAVLPQKRALRPAESSTLRVRITDVEKQPLKHAEVALWVVDEAVLALSNYRVPDPVEVFYAPTADGVTDAHSRLSIVKQEMPAELAEMLGNMTAVQAAMPMMDTADADYEMKPMAKERARPTRVPMVRAEMAKKGGGGEGGEPAPILVRSNFKPLAFYAPNLKTDGNGEVSATFTLPDSLTRYRVMAVAVDDRNRFGNGESSLVVRLPLMVRPAAPRFLNFGDVFEFPVVVQNQTDESQTVQVALKADNLVFGKSVSSLSLSGAGDSIAGREVVVPANDRVEVRFAASTRSAGTASVQVAAAGEGTGDSAMAMLPIWTPATTEAFATYGSVEKGNVIQPVQASKNIWRQFGGLEVTTSSTGLQALTDAFIYLVDYPYSCSEQLASKILAIATLKDVLFAFGSEALPSEDVLKTVVTDALSTLKGRQNWNGEFGLWYRGGNSWPYANVHIANAIALAKEKGFAIDDDMYRRTVQYLTNIEHYLPAWYSEESRLALRSYALYVLAKMGSSNPREAEYLVRQLDGDRLSFEAKGWLLSALKNNDAVKQKLLRDGENHVTRTAKDAHFVTHYSDGEYVLLHSDRRVDGIWLEALLEVDEKNELIPKLMSGLLSHRKQGRWESTQENAFVLCALDKYFHTYERVTPDFVSRVWLGNRASAAHSFSGRTTESAQVNVPMAEVSSQKENLVIEKRGNGRMYYRIGLNYAPKSLSLDAADEGFVVQRTYSGVENDEDVWMDEKGVWHVRAGARVKVELTMVATSRRYHVALEDRLPAGLEPVNPALAVEENVSNTGASPQRNYWWWYRPWFEHQNLRDERVEAFTSLLWDGVYTYSYEAKATTPGTFIVPPAKAVEMYSPETFGRTKTDRMVVE